MRLPLPAWLRTYRRDWLAGDLTAGLIVTVLLIPQSLAYAMLAGLPPQAGLYASILPIVAYALLGTSMSLAVGPAAVASVMTASLLQPLAPAGSAEYAVLAAQLALLSGLMLAAFGMLRLGFLAHFLSHPVVSGFISGSAVLIAVGQLRHLLGVRADGAGVVQTLIALWHALPQTRPMTLAIGLGTLAFLWLARRWLATALAAFGAPRASAELLARLAPMVAVIASIVLVEALDLHRSHGVAVVGTVPQGLPALTLPWPGAQALADLWMPALLISLVGFVESVSVARALALRRGAQAERIAPDRELLALGAANLAAGASGGMPVTGGFARSVVNFAAGARTPLAGIVSAALMAIVIATMTGLLSSLPHAVLAATIIVAVTALIDTDTLREAWHYDRADALALLATAGGVVLLGVEAGIVLGVALSLGVLVWRSSHPHIAVIGRVPGSEHFRNVRRHAVQTVPGLLAIRVDESLYFANASVFEERVEELVAQDPAVRRVLLVCSAVNQIDSTALGMLTRLERTLDGRGIWLWLSEVKGPVMDRLAGTELGQRLRGRTFLSTHDAFVSASRDAEQPSVSP
jgi:SulP family sulfate permease